MRLISILSESPSGLSPSEIEGKFGASRATLNRALRDALSAGDIVRVGAGAATRYQIADPLHAIRAYFERPHTERKFTTYRDELLSVEPAFDTSSLPSIERFSPLEKRDLVRFLVDFSCASSILEGGTYSLLDTQALIEYGEKAPDKPLADAFLVLNHKNAFEYVFEHCEFTSQVVMEVHRRLVDDHGMPALKDAPHFLPKERSGVRRYEDVTIAHSTYAPPTRPATDFLERKLDQIIDTANGIADPIQSSFYLMTRLPYLQPFADGNKRTSRALCSIPLIRAGLPPISFSDFNKRDYILSILSFYELGSTKMASKCFCDAYVASCRRLGLLDENNTDMPAFK